MAREEKNFPERRVSPLAEVPVGLPGRSPAQRPPAQHPPTLGICARDGWVYDCRSQGCTDHLGRHTPGSGSGSLLPGQLAVGRPPPHCPRLRRLSEKERAHVSLSPHGGPCLGCEEAALSRGSTRGAGVRAGLPPLGHVRSDPPAAPRRLEGPQTCLLYSTCSHSTRPSPGDIWWGLLTVPQRCRARRQPPGTAFLVLTGRCSLERQHVSPGLRKTQSHVPAPHRLTQAGLSASGASGVTQKERDLCGPNRVPPGSIHEGLTPRTTECPRVCRRAFQEAPKLLYNEGGPPSGVTGGG